MININKQKNDHFYIPPYSFPYFFKRYAKNLGVFGVTFLTSPLIPSLTLFRDMLKT